MELKIFLTSGLTITVKSDEKIVAKDEVTNILGICDLIEKEKSLVKFSSVLTDKDGKKIVHHYFIPKERISWYLIEEA